MNVLLALGSSFKGLHQQSLPLWQLYLYGTHLEVSCKTPVAVLCCLLAVDSKPGPPLQKLKDIVECVRGQAVDVLLYIDRFDLYRPDGLDEQVHPR